MVPLPARYAALFLRGRGYAPREVWDLLIPLLIEDNLEADCAPLIEWLRLASMANIVLTFKDLLQTRI
jgi:hypothetical protein